MGNGDPEAGITPAMRSVSPEKLRGHSCTTIPTCDPVLFCKKYRWHSIEPCHRAEVSCCYAPALAARTSS